MSLDRALDACEQALRDVRSSALAADPDRVEQAVDDLAHASAALQNATQAVDGGFPAQDRDRLVALRTLLSVTAPYLTVPASSAP